MENSACVVTGSVSFHEISSGSKASSLLFFSAVEVAGIKIILVKKSLKLLQSHCFSEKLLREEVQEGKMMNVQNLFFSSNFELCFVSAFSGECCCQYAQHVSLSFGEAFITPRTAFFSLYLSKLSLRAGLERRDWVCSGTFWDSSHIQSDHLEINNPSSSFVFSLSIPVQPQQLPSSLLFFTWESWSKDTQPRAKSRDKLWVGDICDMVRR